MSKKKTDKEIEKEFQNLFNVSHEKPEPKNYYEKVHRLLDDVRDRIDIDELIYNNMSTEMSKDLIKGIMLGKKMLFQEIFHEFQIRRL